jgi:YHS domain-containing protein
VTRGSLVAASSFLVGVLLGCPDRRSEGYAAPIPDGRAVTDPVDGARCVKGPMMESAVYQGRNHYFCTGETRVKFVAQPARYAASVRIQ